MSITTGHNVICCDRNRRGGIESNTLRKHRPNCVVHIRFNGGFTRLHGGDNGKRRGG